MTDREIQNNGIQTTIAYTSVKKSAGWIRHQNIGILRVRGKDALDLLNRLSTNELRDVAETKGKQTVLSSDKGRIVDVLTVLPYADSYLWLSSAGAIMNDVQHIRKYIIMDDVKLADESGDWAVLEILGPSAMQFLREADDEFPATLQLAERAPITIASVPCECVRMPSACELSFFVLIPPKQADVVIGFLLSLADNLPQLSNDEYEVLRIESGMGKYSNELNDAHNPLEAGLLHLVSFKKGCYIGQEVIARLDTYNKVKQRLVGFRSGVLLTKGAKIIEEGNEVGQITSSVFSPVFGYIALGYIRNEYAVAGKEATIREEIGTTITAGITLLPFTE